MNPGAAHGPLSRLAHRAARLLAGLGTTGLLLLAIGTTADVLLRYGFAAPIRGYADVVALASAALLAACMPQVIASRGNVAVDFAGRLLGATARRWLDRFGALMTLLFFALLAWQYFRFAWSMKEGQEVMPVLRWPVWPWWAAVAVCIAVTALVALFTLNDEGPGGEHD